MSEKLFKFLLSEFKTLRVVCKKCKTVVELDVASLAAAGLPYKCPGPGCQEVLPWMGGIDRTNPLQELARAMLALETCKSVEVQLIVPDTGNP